MFKRILKSMQNQMDIQTNRLDSLTTPSFNWLKDILETIETLDISDENDIQNTNLDTKNQSESSILPEVNNCLSLKSQANELNDILSTDEENSENDVKTQSKNNSQIHYPASKENLPANSSIEMCSSCSSILQLTEQDSELYSNNSYEIQKVPKPRNFEISGIASQLTTSAQIFRQKWKESISQNSTQMNGK